MKLDYEQQCYRQSEMIVRARLDQLQKTIEEATKPTSHQPVEEATAPTNRRQLRGECHTFVRQVLAIARATFGLPLIVVIQLWVDSTTATGILAVFTLIGNLPMPIIPTDIWAWR